MLKSIGVFLILGMGLFILKSQVKAEREEQTIVISREKIKEAAEFARSLTR